MRETFGFARANKDKCEYPRPFMLLKVNSHSFCWSRRLACATRGVPLRMIRENKFYYIAKFSHGYSLGWLSQLYSHVTGLHYIRIFLGSIVYYILQGIGLVQAKAVLYIGYKAKTNLYRNI